MDLAGSERQKDTNAVGQRLKVSERPLHVLTCTHSFTHTYEIAVIFLFTKSNKCFSKEILKSTLNAIYAIH